MEPEKRQLKSRCGLCKGPLPLDAFRCPVCDGTIIMVAYPPTALSELIFENEVDYAALRVEWSNSRRTYTPEELARREEEQAYLMRCAQARQQDEIERWNSSAEGQRYAEEQRRSHEERERHYGEQMRQLDEERRHVEEKHREEAEEKRHQETLLMLARVGLGIASGMFNRH